MRRGLAPWLVLTLCVNSSQAAVRRVPSEYPTIQEGIDVCQAGDTVLVAAGSYSGPGNLELHFNGIGCVVQSESGPEMTTIDCENAGKGVNSIDDGSAQFEIAGFTITRAAYINLPGGAIAARDDDLTLKNMRFIGNSSTFGGAIYVGQGRLEVINCRFEGNHADWNGGAIVATVGAVAEIVDCEFIGNQAGATGGAVYGYAADSITVRDCIVQGNLAGAVGGGGIAIGSHSRIERVAFIENESHNDAGALSLSGADNTALVLDCEFIGNRASGGSGGAISMGVGFEEPGYALIERCLFLGNTATFGGGGIGCGNYSAPVIRNCTLVGNSADVVGGGIFMHWYASPVLEQVLVTGNLENGGVSVDGVSTPELICCNLWGNVGGDYVGGQDPTGTDGNISADPRFCGAQPDDFTLQANSPCAPANNSCGVLIGLYGVDCDSVNVRSESWGGIKSRY